MILCVGVKWHRIDNNYKSMEHENVLALSVIIKLPYDLDIFNKCHDIKNVLQLCPTF